MILKRNKRGSVVDQPWTEVLQMTVLIVFLLVFIPAMIRWCSQSAKAYSQNTDLDTFDVIAAYVDQFPVNQQTAIPLKIHDPDQKKYFIRVFARCKGENEKPGTECLSEPKMCLYFKGATKRAPYCHTLKSGDIPVDFAATDDVTRISDGFRVEKTVVEDAKRGNRHVITFQSR